MTDKRKEIARDICKNYDVTLSAEALQLFADILEPFKLLRGQNLVAEGEVCHYMYYVEKGLVLQYYKKNNMTVTEHISHEGDMVICIESYFKQEPSKIIATMLEPGVLYGIPYDGIKSIAHHSYEICNLMFAIDERSLIISQQKADVLRFESAKERYVRTLHENPEIIRRAPLHHVASLLQMTPETLSRVRSQVTENEWTIYDANKNML